MIQKMNVRFMELFKALCISGETLISADKIQIDTVSLKCLEVLQPLLEEMETLEERLDIEEFVESCYSLYRECNVEQRANLLNYKKHEHTF